MTIFSKTGKTCPLRKSCVICATVYGRKLMVSGSGAGYFISVKLFNKSQTCSKSCSGILAARTLKAREYSAAVGKAAGQAAGHAFINGGIKASGKRPSTTPVWGDADKNSTAEQGAAPGTSNPGRHVQ